MDELNQIPQKNPTCATSMSWNRDVERKSETNNQGLEREGTRWKQNPMRQKKNKQ
ncbi:hypothetical protein SESBI_21349 [Sesbania bispinosa]|nr:hypothetical protein SESBI_21349 [Sesbania bispinosa]